MSELEKLFFANSIGFDRLATLVGQKPHTYPPHNLVKVDENSYVLSFAVAGFGKDDIDVEVKDNILTIKGDVNEKFKNMNFIHKGIATRQFKSSFELDKFLEVKDALMEDGLLHIKLVREVPEAAKPKKIDIKSDKSQLLLE